MAAESGRRMGWRHSGSWAMALDAQDTRQDAGGGVGDDLLAAGAGGVGAQGA
jgi:hypothetical protein